MQFSNARVARSGQMRKDVPFPLCNPKTIQEDANAVRGAMDFGNQAKRISQHGDRMKLSFLRRFPERSSTYGIGTVSNHPTPPFRIVELAVRQSPVTNNTTI